MIALDTNILIYAHRQDTPFHSSAKALLRNMAEQHHPWCIPWPCLHEFYSIVTHKKIYSPPSTPEQAIFQIKSWVESPSLLLIAENDQYQKALIEKTLELKIRGPMIHDLKILLICESNGVKKLLTFDRDFSKFNSLIVEIQRPF